MSDLDGLMKQSKELINMAHSKGVKEGFYLMKKLILEEIDRVENEPTGARYWIGTQELKNILERY
jgi:hypothetical protein